MKSQRIQLSRKKGFRLPDNTVVVSRPSKWGNPFKVIAPEFQHLAVQLFERQLKEFGAYFSPGPVTIEDIQRELKGRNLACWCPPGPCHADHLLSIANVPAGRLLCEPSP